MPSWGTTGPLAGHQLCAGQNKLAGPPCAIPQTLTQSWNSMGGRGCSQAGKKQVTGSQLDLGFGSSVVHERGPGSASLLRVTSRSNASLSRRSEVACGEGGGVGKKEGSEGLGRQQRGGGLEAKGRGEGAGRVPAIRSRLRLIKKITFEQI